MIFHSTSPNLMDDLCKIYPLMLQITSGYLKRKSIYVDISLDFNGRGLAVNKKKNARAIKKNLWQ